MELPFPSARRLEKLEHLSLDGRNDAAYAFVVGVGILFGTYSGVLLLANGVWFYLRRRESRISRIGPRYTVQGYDGNHAVDRLSMLGEGIADDPGATKMQQTGYRKMAFGRVVKYGWYGLLLLMQVVLASTLIAYYCIEGRGGEELLFCFCMFYYPSGIVMCICSQLPAASHWFLARCSLENATHVLIEEESFRLEDDTLFTQVRLFLNRVFTRRRLTLVKITVDRGFQQRRYFSYACVTYLWNSEFKRFRPCGAPQLRADRLPRKGLNGRVAQSLLDDCQNVIDVHVPSVFRALCIEFFDPVYIYQFYSIWLAVAFGRFNMGLIYFLATVGSGSHHALYQVRRQQFQIRELVQIDEAVEVLRDLMWTVISSTKLVPTDLMRVLPGIVPCDCVLIEGGVVVNEAVVTGEPLPAHKVPIPQEDVVIEASVHKQHILFAGSEVIWVERAFATVLATGAMTARGQLVRGLVFPSVRRFRQTADFPNMFCLAIIYGFITMLFIVSQSPIPVLYMIFLGSYNVVQAMNPLLPVSLMVGQSAGKKRLDKLGIQCLAPPRLACAGKLQVVIFDKTGTLTKSTMSLVAIQQASKTRMNRAVYLSTRRDDPTPIQNKLTPQKVLQEDAGEGIRASQKALQEAVDEGIIKSLWTLALATCHTVEYIDGELVGSEVEVRMFNSSGWRFSRRTSLTSSISWNSQFSANGINSKKKAGARHKRRVGHIFEGPRGEVAEVLRMIDFNHAFMTSGALVRIRDEKGHRVILFLKGSEDRISAVCDVPADFRNVVNGVLESSLYVLGLAYREVPEMEVNALTWASRAELERGLDFLGLLLFHNDIKPESKHVIGSLRVAQLWTVMCSGDSVFSALAVAKELGMIDQRDSRVVVGELRDGQLVWQVDGAVIEESNLIFQTSLLAVTGHAYNALAIAGRLGDVLMRIQVFGRMTPDQKVDLVHRYQDRDLIVGMCGDGGNDCAALRAAHVGVALSDAEACIVAPFSCGGSKSPSVMLNILKVGRACLDTNLACFKFFLLSGLGIVHFKVVIVLEQKAALPAEWQIIYLDIISPIIFTFAMATCCHAVNDLAPKRPASSIFSLRNVLSVMIPHAFFIVMVTLVLLKLSTKEYFREYDVTFANEVIKGGVTHNWRLGDTYTQESLWLVLVPYLCAMAMVFSTGGVYRRPLYKSPAMILLMVCVIFFCCTLLFTGPNWFGCIFRVNCSNEVSRKTYVPFFTEFGASGIGDCFYGPDADEWFHPENYELPNATRYLLSPFSTPKCSPPEGSGLNMKLDPNNVMNQRWRLSIFFAALFLVASVVVFSKFGLDALHRAVYNLLPQRLTHDGEMSQPFL